MTKYLRSFLACLFGAGVLLSLHPLAQAKAAVKKPNFVIIQTDDQPLSRFHETWRDYSGRVRQVMPYTMGMIKDQGIEFTDYMTPFPLCAPSRASLWSGEYAHNDGVIRIGGPRGGWSGYRTNPIYNQNLAVWLQRAGYRTSHFGKFMNYYGGPDKPAEATVPPGWDRWVSDATDNSTRENYGYTLNVDGAIEGPLGWPGYGDQTGRDPVGCPFTAAETCNYHEDKMSLDAVDEIATVRRRQPFFLQVDYHTPHGDFRPPIGPEPPVRYYDTAIRTPMPKPLGFNEPNMSDKPSFLRDGLARLTRHEKQQITMENQKSIEALRAVDDGVHWMVDELKRRNLLRNTYFIFTSDNGFFAGEHRITRGKLLPYDPSIKVPLVIRGPGIRKGSTSSEPVANQDIAPTVMHLAGARPGRRVDGRSMVRFWRKPQRRSRRPILLSSYQLATHLIPGDFPDVPDPVVTSPSPGGVTASGVPSQENYVGIRLGPYKYVKYEGGESELYMLTRDPGELHNRFDDPRFSRVRKYLARQLSVLRGCKAASCRANAPRWPRPGPRRDQRGRAR